MHHAYLLLGERAEAEGFIHSFWQEKGIELKNSPDFFVWKEDLFGIDEARKVAEAASRKAFTGQKVFLIVPDRITPEAQNALLKTFEDPPVNTYFFLVAREEELVLPTLRSRMLSTRLDSKASEVGEAQAFLKLGLKERLAFARKFADAEKNLSVFLDQLLNFMRKESLPTEAIRAVYDLRRYSDDRAASSRLILEHLALMI